MVEFAKPLEENGEGEASHDISSEDLSQSVDTDPALLAQMNNLDSFYSLPQNYGQHVYFQPVQNGLQIPQTSLWPDMYRLQMNGVSSISPNILQVSNAYASHSDEEGASSESDTDPQTSVSPVTPTQRSHSFNETGEIARNAPEMTDFVRKLHFMLDENSELHGTSITWGKDYASLVIRDVPNFTKDILPRYFKHQNYQSFVRQLNKYGFSKKRLNDDGERSDTSLISEYVHDKFQRNNYALLAQIVRKQPQKTSASKDESKCAELMKQVEELQLENRTLKNERNEYNSKLTELKNERMELKYYLQRLSDKVNEQENSLLQLQRKEELRTSFAQLQISAIPYHMNPDAKQNNTLQALKRKMLRNSTELTEANVSRSDGKPPIKKTRSQIDLIRKARRGRDLKVLVVDDDQVGILTIMKWLELYGCKPESVTSGLDAILKTQTTKFDIVLMDIMMPELDGIEATKQIRLKDRHTVIVAMTSQVGQQYIDTYRAVGMDQVLPKTGNRDQFLNTIASLHDRLPAKVALNISRFPTSSTLMDDNTEDDDFSTNYQIRQRNPTISSEYNHDLDNHLFSQTPTPALYQEPTVHFSSDNQQDIFMIMPTVPYASHSMPQQNPQPQINPYFGTPANRYHHAINYSHIPTRQLNTQQSIPNMTSPTSEQPSPFHEVINPSSVNFGMASTAGLHLQSLEMIPSLTSSDTVSPYELQK
ncbi:kinase-regulated stress-responsive transcription factor skn7 [Nowakowskiella sp. JEL0407]|nr:kinase-regulated stress-responsive transcription factor skn7 [Nowakowskiella sp. JEL0407]